MFLRQAFSRHAPRLIRPAAACVTARRTMTTAGQSLQQLAAEFPHVDVIRYEHKNVKFTLRHVDRSADSLAIGLLDCGLAPGDVVLSWLPSHFAEQHILQFACSKAGFTLFTLPASIATTDPVKAKEALAKALELSKANVLITQEAGNDTNYIRIVEEVIPEIRIFNMDDGMPFFTPRFPHLRLPIHTGFDYQDKGGMIPLMDMLCDTEDLEGILKATGKIVDGKTGLLGEFEYGKDGVPTKVGKVLNNDEVLASGVWPEFVSVLKKEYREVEGVGVVF